MGSALINPPPQETAAAEALRLQVAERLAAHRDRRSRQRPQPPVPRPQAPPPTETRAARIAATVAERYAQSQSYRDFLAAEAERAVQQAHAAAEIAARNAEAAVEAHQQLLADLEQAALEQAARDQARQEEEVRERALQPAPTLWPELAISGPSSEVGGPSFPVLSESGVPGERSLLAGVRRVGYRAEARPSSSPAATHSKSTPRTKRTPEPTTPPQIAPALTVHLFGDAAPTAPQPPAPHAQPSRNPEDSLEARALDEEIAFRHAPVFEEPVGPPTALPANLIEFPRQLVASRKARPRHAEGPLREEELPQPDDSQLRIFEVDPAHISTSPDLVDGEPPQWTSLWLDAAAPHYAEPAAAVDDIEEPQPVAVPRPQPAAVPRRLLAAAIDMALVFTGLLAAAATGAAVATHTPHIMQLRHAGASQPTLAIATAAVSLFFLWLLYQALFVIFSDATPGMRAARIALCTLSDENPTRRAMRRRIPAVALSLLPAGLGLAWAFLDEDRLTWHDRISRMYPRSY